MNDGKNCASENKDGDSGNKNWVFINWAATGSGSGRVKLFVFGHDDNTPVYIIYTGA